MSTLLGIFVGLLMLSIMMLVHELGHFLAGKALGFKIISFNLFMGPILYKRTGKDGIVFTIRLVPMGASVEFAGEDSGINELPEDAEGSQEVSKFSPDDPGLFYNRPRWARAIVVAMGPLVNFLTAFLAFLILFTGFGVSLPQVEAVEPNSLVAEAGLRPGDRILKINDSKIFTILDYTMIENFQPHEVQNYQVQGEDGQLRDLRIEREFVESYRLGISYSPRPDGRMLVTNVDPRANEGSPLLKVDDEIVSAGGVSVQDKAAFDAFLADRQGESFELEIIREGKTQTLDMTLTHFRELEPLGNLQMVHTRGLGSSLQQAFAYPISVIRSTFQGLGMLFSGQIAPQDGLSGPVGIVAMVGDVVEGEAQFAEKISQLLLYFAYISVAVGFTNLLPIPPFDGFHLLVLAVEGTIRRNLPEKVKEGFSMVGLVLILLLVVYVFYIDLSRLFLR
ncbi:MAG: RIP metalloprotease RseP [Eubacteriales bacterium]|nr:RIP metalloprotease RseP [Eubacteriales bacterium]